LLSNDASRREPPSAMARGTAPKGCTEAQGRADDSRFVFTLIIMFVGVKILS
jgi:hypothetical protein